MKHFLSIVAIGVVCMVFLARARRREEDSLGRSVGFVPRPNEEESIENCLRGRLRWVDNKRYDNSWRPDERSQCKSENFRGIDLCLAANEVISLKKLSWLFIEFSEYNVLNESLNYIELCVEGLHQKREAK